MDVIAAALGIDLGDPEVQASLAMRRERHALVDKLVAMRTERDIRQSDIAKKLGISREAVSRIEREGRDPRLSTLIRYAEAIGAALTFDAMWMEESVAYQRTSKKKGSDMGSSPFGEERTWAHTGTAVERIKGTVSKQNRTDFVMAA